MARGWESKSVADQIEQGEEVDQRAAEGHPIGQVARGQIAPRATRIVKAVSLTDVGST